jgi:DNA-binding CsgD family transcriptional regulator
MAPDRLDALVGHGRAELSSLLPDLGPAAQEPRRGQRSPDAPLTAGAAHARIFEVLLGLLRRLSHDAPVVLVLEDLHWADTSTRDLLGFLARNAIDARLLIVATYRSDELHRRHALRPLLVELERLDGVDDLELGAFDAGEVAQQLKGITGETAPAGLVSTVLARSGGNPFFAEEILAAGEAGLSLPRSLRDTVADRIHQLGEDAQHVLRVASVAGERVDHRLLEAVGGVGEGRLAHGLREAIEHHLLIPSAPDAPPGYAFRHALVQETAYEELLPAERTQLHAAYAQAIESREDIRLAEPSATPALLAHHWLRAHDLARAVPAALAAGRAAAAGFAFAEAQTFLERALELWPKVPPDELPADVDRLTIMEEAAEAAVQAGDARRSIDLARSALAEVDPVADPARAGILHHRLAWYFNESGDWQAGVVALERAVELIPIDPPTRARARVLADVAHSLMVRGRFGDSLAMAEAALAISRAVDAPIAEARALNAMGLDLACRSDLERAIPILRDGYARAMRVEDPLAIFLTAVGLGWALDEAARHAESLDLALETRRHLAEIGAGARFGGQLASKAARALYELGRWDDAAALIDETIAAGPTRYALRWLLTNRVRLHAGRGNLAAAEADLATYEALGERVVGPDPDLVSTRRAELAIAAGSPREARELVRETLARIVEPELDTDARALLLLGLRAEAAEADLARAAHDPRRIEAAVARGADLNAALRRHLVRVAEVAANPARIIDADRLLADALLGRIGGEDGASAWEAAGAARRQLGRPFELADVLAHAAEALLAERRREDGAAALAEAHAIAVELGATPLRLRIESLARRAHIGLEGVETVEDAADRLGLTRREREVLALLASGRSNRQIGEQLFMAESTAGVHVSNILAKLGVNGRHEAAAVANRIGLGGG